jgi:Domain of unknown function (DUF4198)
MKRNVRPMLGAILLSTWTLVLAPVPSDAHQYWLSPSRYRIEPRADIELGAVVGTGFRGKGVSWTAERCVRFLARSSETVDLARATTSGDLVWTRLRVSDTAGAMIAFESTFSPIELPAHEFDEYLEEEGLDEPLRERRLAPSRPGRERYRRCAKLWLSGDDPARATEPLGLPMEIVPDTAPGAHRELRLRVLSNGAPVSRALVKAWHRPVLLSGRPFDPTTRDSIGTAWSGRTDARGRVTVPVSDAGEWLISVVRMERCKDSDDADWESTWASLTFERSQEDSRAER